MKTTAIHHAKTCLSRILREVRAGESVVILHDGAPIAKLTPIGPLEAKRPPVGTRTSEPVRYDDDAFSPLEGKGLEEWGL